jgi:hypothetical protein
MACAMLAKPGDPLGGRIAVRARLAGGLDQLVDDMLGCGEVGVSHAKVDDVDAARPFLRLDLVHLLENIGRQALDLVEVSHGFLLGRPHAFAVSPVSSQEIALALANGNTNAIILQNMEIYL